ncbi:MAG: hypothetical protein ACLR3X_09530 [Intestinibacter bartlettii]
MVNVVDDKELSNFTVPSYVKRGELLLSISTGEIVHHYQQNKKRIRRNI